MKNVVPVSALSETDDADRSAAKYFREHADGREHLLVFNGEIHDTTLYSTKDRVWHDPEKLKAIIRAGKPLVLFHNHPADGGRAAMFPSYDDFGVAGLFSFMAYVENPDLPIEFRVMQPGSPGTIVSYGFKKAAVESIKKVARSYLYAAASKSDPAPIPRGWRYPGLPSRTR